MPWLLLALALVPAGAHAGQEARAARTREYLATIERYEAGDTEGAVAALADHDAEWVGGAVEDVARPSRDWPARRLQAAVLMHADAVIDGWVLPSRRDAHLAASRRLAGMNDPRVPDAFRRDWVLVVAWYLLSELDLAATPAWLDLAVTRFGADPEVQVTLGTFFEALGWEPRLPTPFPWDAAVLRDMPDRTQRAAWQQAALAYRRALAAAPDAPAARVRLARVLVLLRQPGEADVLLPPVLAADADRTWSYLGWLTSALAHTERARLDAAAEAYERAATLLPGCPTAMLGLSAIRRLQGRLLDSAAAAEALVAGGTRCDDPWSFYRFGEWPDVRARRLLGLRRMVTGP